MPRRKPTLEEREKAVAAREQALAVVLPLIHPVLTKLTALFQQWDEENDPGMIVSNPQEWLMQRARREAAEYVLRELQRGTNAG